MSEPPDPTVCESPIEREGEHGEQLLDRCGWCPGCSVHRFLAAAQSQAAPHKPGVRVLIDAETGGIELFADIAGRGTGEGFLLPLDPVRQAADRFCREEQ